MTDHITVVGNIATQPEQRRTAAGVAVTSFRLASGQRHFDSRTGQWVDGITNWYRVSAFRALGENAFASLLKGQRIVVTGKLKLKTWESGDKKGTEVEIDADALGPDLLWGTASFTRVARGEASAPSDDAVGGARTGTDQAASPASRTDEHPPAVTTSATAPEVSDWDAAPLGETPF